MNTAIRLFLGLPIPRGEFQGTSGEKAVYEFAVRQWRAAGFKVRAERFLSRTLGANVRRSAILMLPIAVLTAACGTSPTEPTEARTKVVGNTNCPLDQKDMYVRDLAFHQASLPEARN